MVSTHDRKELAQRAVAANSFLHKLIPTEKGGEKENGKAASPEGGEL